MELDITPTSGLRSLRMISLLPWELVLVKTTYLTKGSHQVNQRIHVAQTYCQQVHYSIIAFQFQKGNYE